MTDFWTPEVRGKMMAAIKGRGNLSTEIRVLTLIKAAGLTGWRRHLRLPGKPDFAFPRLKVAVFCDGDFWHGNPLTYKPPKSNTEFWEAKVKYNRSHDRQVTALLRSRGWCVVRVWESDLRKNPKRVLSRIRRALAFAKRRAQSAAGSALSTSYKPTNSR